MLTYEKQLYCGFLPAGAGTVAAADAVVGVAGVAAGVGTGLALGATWEVAGLVDGVVVVVSAARFVEPHAATSSTQASFMGRFY